MYEHELEIDSLENLSVIVEFTLESCLTTAELNLCCLNAGQRKRFYYIV